MRLRMKPDRNDRKGCALIPLLAWAALLASIASGAAAQDRPGDFDFYLLSLSWSPTFCAREEGAEDSPQCAPEADFGFVVHGLWPQREQGYPEDCAENPERVPRWLVASMLDIMPDTGLVQHEWRTHGVCTGLAMEDYFEATRAAWQSLRIPAKLSGARGQQRLSAGDIERAFVAANEGLAADGIAVTCDRGWLEEVRICLARDLSFRACEEVDRRGCRQDRLLLPPPA